MHCAVGIACCGGIIGDVLVGDGSRHGEGRAGEGARCSTRLLPRFFLLLSTSLLHSSLTFFQQFFIPHSFATIENSDPGAIFNSKL